MYADVALFNVSDWRGDPRRRLSVALLLAGIVVVGLMSQLRMPVTVSFPALNNLSVNIIVPTREVPQSEVPARDVIPVPDASSQADVGAGPVVAPAPEQEQAPPIDFEQLIINAVAQRPNTPAEPALNPAFERLRRESAEQFAPIQRREKKPIWENVEKDLTGRTILRSGDCWRVLNDPNVGSREMFEVFGQYLTFCSNYKRKPQQLEWVDDINARREGPSRYAPPSAE